jgi:hypothetical protein
MLELADAFAPRFASVIAAEVTADHVTGDFVDPFTLIVRGVEPAKTRRSRLGSLVDALAVPLELARPTYTRRCGAIRSCAGTAPDFPANSTPFP